MAMVWWKVKIKVSKWGSQEGLLGHFQPRSVTLVYPFSETQMATLVAKAVQQIQMEAEAYGPVVVRSGKAFRPTSQKGVNAQQDRMAALVA